MLLVGAAGYGLARYANLLSGQVVAVFLGLGVLVAFVSWFQMRLEEREKLEKLELDEMARSKASATLFEGKDSEVFPAQRSREQFERFFVPGFAFVLLLLQGGAALFLWRWLGGVLAPEPLRQEMVAMSLFALLALILFLIGRFSATIARLENHRLLRPGANYLLLAAYLCAFAALAVAGITGEFPNADLYVARGLVIVLGLIAPPAYLSLCLGSENQPSGRRPVTSARISVVRSSRAFSSARSSVLTSSCLNPCAAISWPSAINARSFGARCSASTAGTAKVARMSNRERVSRSAASAPFMPNCASGVATSAGPMRAGPVSGDRSTTTLTQHRAPFGQAMSASAMPRSSEIV